MSDREMEDELYNCELFISNIKIFFFLTFLRFFYLFRIL